MTTRSLKVFGLKILFKFEWVSYATCLHAKIDLYVRIGQLQFNLATTA
jgi:hypothetical protein